MSPLLPFLISIHCLYNRNVFFSGFGVDLQRPGLDGSSSDSDDDSPLNFARSRIGTVHQQHLTAFLEDRQPDSGSEVLGSFLILLQNVDVAQLHILVIS